MGLFFPSDVIMMNFAGGINVELEKEKLESCRPFR